jgi:peroxin-1
VVGWACQEMYERIGRRLGVKGEYLPVRMKRRKGQQEKDDVADEEEKGEKGEMVKSSEDHQVDIWLGEWDQVPDGCTVIQGLENWQEEWAFVE